MDIFTDARDYREFEFLLAQVVDEFDVECWGFCGMRNHYHAIIRPTRANISDAMRKLNGEYGQWWNQRHGKVGHVFQGRFKDQIVQGDKYLMTLMRYVARNPLRAGFVEDLAAWPSGSYRALSGLETPPSFLSVDSVLRQFGTEDLATLQGRFAALVLGDKEDAAILDRIRSRDLVIGDSEFAKAVRNVRKAESERASRKELPRSLEIAV
jgi:REP element-mobilizing transposase RayT